MGWSGKKWEGVECVGRGGESVHGGEGMRRYWGRGKGESERVQSWRVESEGKEERRRKGRVCSEGKKQKRRKGKVCSKGNKRVGSEGKEKERESAQ